MLQSTANPPAGTTLKTGLVMLATLQGLMLAALFTRTMPHPPFEVTPFALAPFLSAAIALALAALGAGRSGIGTILALGACLAALVSFGPHKWFDPVFSRIWPAVLLAQIAIIMVAIGLFTEFRRRRGNET